MLGLVFSDPTFSEEIIISLRGKKKKNISWRGKKNFPYEEKKKKIISWRGKKKKSKDGSILIKTFHKT